MTAPRSAPPGAGETPASPPLPPGGDPTTPPPLPPGGDLTTPPPPPPGSDPTTPPPPPPGGDLTTPPPASPGGGAASLADRQAGLVAALTSGAPVPPGFDPRLVDVARVALLRKRAGEVARQWPALAAAHGPEWTRVFARWAAARPTHGSLRDGWDLARDLGDRLPAAAAEEVATREAAWFYDGVSAPRSRRMPAVRRAGGCVALQIAGRVRIMRRPPD